jgi:hypothetical protein
MTNANDTSKIQFSESLREIHLLYKDTLLEYLADQFS